jgi:DNA-directed RNA polymerase subunit RPC12/RpoP
MKGKRVTIYICNNCEGHIFLDEDTVKEHEGGILCPFCGESYFVSLEDFEEGFYTLN